MILVDEEIPVDALDQLINLTSGYEWCVIEKVPRDVSISSIASSVADRLTDGEACYATFRIDDDDALSKSFLKSLNLYVRNEFVGYAITFPCGVQAFFSAEKNRFVKASKVWRPKLALGLSLISSVECKRRTVFDLGRHTSVDRRHPMIVVPDGPMYIRTIHEGNDSLNFLVG